MKNQRTVNGMSIDQLLEFHRNQFGDTRMEADEDAGGSQPTGDTQPASNEPPVENVADMELPAGVDKFDRQYVEKLRNENAAARQRAKDAEARAERFQVFEQFEEGDQEIWQNLARTWLQNPNDSAAAMREIANNVLGDPNATQEQKEQAVQDVKDVEAAQENPQLTEEKVNELVAERMAEAERRRTQDQAVAQINKQIADAGFEQGTVDHFSILWMVNNDKSLGGDLDKAIEAWKARERGAVDNYLNGVRGGANPRSMPDRGTGGTEQPPAPRRGHEFEDARKAADSFLANQGRT